MAIELYWGSGSPFAWRVMLTLELKRLAYESKLLEFSKQEHKTAAYLQLNPRGKVPALKDGDFLIYESIAIMAYLDRKYPTPEIFGRTPKETGLVWRWICECESYLLGPTDKVVRPLFFGRGLEKTDEIQQAAQVIRQELKRIDDDLANCNWLVGAEISGADIAIFPVVQLLLRAAGKEAAQPLNLCLIPLSETFPNIARWMQRIEELPNYQRTYPPHWRG
jgi:glutathione S-transferase